MLEKYKEFVANGPTDFSISEINGISLSVDYIDFVSRYNGGEGDIGYIWVILYDKEELLEYNEYDYIYEDERFKDAVTIGSNGGGEYFGIDSKGNYFVTPAIGSEEDTVWLGKSILEFLEGLNEYFCYDE